MRLNVTVKRSEHSDIGSAVAWSSDGQLLSCADDRVICRWNADGESAGKITTMQNYVTSVCWFPVLGKQASADMFAVSCTDGTMRFMSRSGREEKKVDAHEGAAILVKWSHDGAALLTGGDDGNVKIWSRSANLRSVLASTGQSVYTACWGPDDNQVLIASGDQLLVKTVQANSKNLQWKAHDGIVLCVDWNVANGHIVSGGEDCTYRVWDGYGRQLYCSRPMEHVVTSIGWSPTGECFAVGSSNLVRLCDKTGWTHCRERLDKCGSVLSLAWTSDGTQLAGATGDGSVLFAQVVDRRFEWKDFEVTLLEPRKLRVQDVGAETLEDLEFARDRVVEVGLGYDFLIVTTSSQCYVYNLGNLNTPIIFDIKAPPSFVQLCEKHFLTLDQISGLQIISYEGRVLCSPRFQGLRPEYLTRDMVALSADVVAVVDSVESKNIVFLDTQAGKVTNKLVHNAEVTDIALNQHSLNDKGVGELRLLAFADKNRDLYVANLTTVASSSNKDSTNTVPTYKLQPHVESFRFNDSTNVLVSLADGRMMTWLEPSVAFTDKDLVSLSTLSSEDASDKFGRNAIITAFTGSRASVRKVDGSVVFFAVPIDVNLLYELTRNNKWDESVRLCRHQKSNSLWAALASMALAKKQLDCAEVALAEINEIPKVEYIQKIKDIPTEEGKQAEMALFRRAPDEAERILLQASPPLAFRAVKMRLDLFQFPRALEIALKFQCGVEIVLFYRKRYLDTFGKKEMVKEFVSQVSRLGNDFTYEDVVKMEADLSQDERANFSGRAARK